MTQHICDYCRKKLTGFEPIDPYPWIRARKPLVVFGLRGELTERTIYTDLSTDFPDDLEFCSIDCLSNYLDFLRERGNG